MGGTATTILLIVVSKEGNSLDINFLHERKITPTAKKMIKREINFFITYLKGKLKRTDFI